MESPFIHLLRTNYVPSVSEMDEIKTHLLGATEELGLLDAEILQLQATIDALRTKRQKLYTYIIDHQALLTPMRRIPQDILQEIFIRCLPVHHNAVISHREAPLLLGRVCSWWRKISTSIPHLWSSIHVTIPEYDRYYVNVGDPLPPTDQGYVLALSEAVNTWLSRSGDLPLSLSFRRPYCAETEVEETIVSSLVQFSSRWQHAIFEASPLSAPMVASLSKGATPLLETLSFHIIDHIVGGSRVTPCDVFQQPTLKALSFSHLALLPTNFHWSQWSQLTNLSIEAGGREIAGLSSTRALEILRHCQNLIYCRFDLGPDDMLSSGVSELDITVPCLRTMFITETSDTPTPFFSHLRLPALTDLRLSTRSALSDQVSICELTGLPHSVII